MDFGTQYVASTTHPHPPTQAHGDFCWANTNINILANLALFYFFATFSIRNTPPPHPPPSVRPDGSSPHHFLVCDCNDAWMCAADKDASLLNADPFPVVLCEMGGINWAHTHKHTLTHTDLDQWGRARWEGVRRPLLSFYSFTCGSSNVSILTVELQ